MQPRREIVENFRNLGFHDDTFVSMKVLPAQSQGDNIGSIVEILLLQYSEQKSRLLRLTGCVNLRIGIDFDVLAHNFPPNTYGVEAHVDQEQMWSLMQSQTRDWGVEYAAGMSTPLDRKLYSMNELVCFRVRLCGGVVEIIAREYQVESVDK